jgi:predicted outer membrane repeat protein
VHVRCSTAALTADISADTTGAALQLAPDCTYLLASALPDVTADLTLVGTGSYATIKRSGAAPAFSLLTVTSGAHLMTDGVNFTSGAPRTSLAVRSTWPMARSPSRGASSPAIPAASPGLVVNGGVFKQNTAPSEGGAIFSRDGMTLTGPVFSYNNAGADGGAVCNFGPAAVTRATFAHNSARIGGGFYNNWTVDLSGSSFTANTAAGGGGLYNRDIAAVSGTSFTANTDAVAGGAIQQDSQHPLAMTASRVEYNRAPAGAGGGILDGGGTVALSGTTVAWNRVNNCSPAASVAGCAG